MFVGREKCLLRIEMLFNLENKKNNISGSNVPVKKVLLSDI
jgi:hypothetical protein